jgi:hypothetical protein
MPNKVGKQDEHEQREDKGEKSHPLRPRRIPEHTGDEFVAHLRGSLPTARNKAATSGGKHQKGCDGASGGEHEKRGIGEGEIDAGDFNGNNR